MFNPYQTQIDELEAKIAETEALVSDPDFAELAQLELESLNQQKNALLEAALQYEQGFEGDSSDASEERINCTIEIRSGAGGDEAKIWGNDLLRMYVRFAEMHKLKITAIDDMVVKISGKTTTLPEIHKDGKSYISAYELLKYESGVHRVQRVPETEAQGRIHTSTASVAVLPEIHSKEIEIKEEDLEWQFMRSSGAGGQSVNKTSSAARLIHKPTGITIVSRQEKKQEQNRKIAIELLRAQLWEIEEEKKEKTHYDIELTKFDGAKKIALIKEIRAILNLGLKEAKDMVEGAPVWIKKEVKKEDAEKIQAKLKELGGECRLA